MGRILDYFLGTTPETPEQLHHRQLAESATRAAVLLDRFGSPDAADEATAAAGEHWQRALGLSNGGA